MRSEERYGDAEGWRSHLARCLAWKPSAERRGEAREGVIKTSPTMRQKISPAGAAATHAPWDKRLRRWGATRCGHAKYDIDQLTSRPRQASLNHEWNGWQDRRRDEGRRRASEPEREREEGRQNNEAAAKMKTTLRARSTRSRPFLWTIPGPLWSGLRYLAKMLCTCAENCQNQATVTTTTTTTTRTTRTSRRTTMKTGFLCAVSLG